jgi:acylphosphatase
MLPSVSIIDTDRHKSNQTEVDQEMKLKVKITGPRVHEVGYRYFLMDTALDLGLQGFYAGNQIDDGQQQVIIASVEGNEDAVADFKKVVESTWPENAEVSGISYSDFEGYVRDAGDFAQIYTAHQLNKAIHLLLDMNRNLKEINGNLKAVKYNTDMIPQIARDTKEIKEEIEPILKL